MKKIKKLLNVDKPMGSVAGTISSSGAGPGIADGLQTLYWPLLSSDLIFLNNIMMTDNISF